MFTGLCLGTTLRSQTGSLSFTSLSFSLFTSPGLSLGFLFLGLCLGNTTCILTGYALSLRLLTG